MISLRREELSAARGSLSGSAQSVPVRDNGRGAAPEIKGVEGQARRRFGTADFLFKGVGITGDPGEVAPGIEIAVGALADAEGDVNVDAAGFGEKRCHIALKGACHGPEPGRTVCSSKPHLALSQAGPEFGAAGSGP